MLSDSGGITLSAGNTSHGVIVGDISGAPVTIGHTTSETTISDNLTVTGTQTYTGTALHNNTITVGSDGTGHDVKYFGATAGAFMEWDESADELEIRGGAATAGKLLLSTAETTVVDGNKLGQIDFQAPLEGSGTDSILVGASIYAEANDTFAADNNETELVFATGASEAAAEKMRIDSSGNVGIGTATPLSAAGRTSLTISGAGGGNLYLRDNPDEDSWMFDAVDTSLKIGLDNDDDGEAEVSVMTMLSDGRVGMGISPLERLHIDSSGDTIIRLDSGGSGWSGFKLCDDGTIDWWIQNIASNGRLQLMDTGEDNGLYLDQNSNSWAAGVSDERLKKDWENFEDATDKINTLTKMGTYNLINPSPKSPDKKIVGLSANEVQKILPEAVDENDDGHLSLRYQDVFVLMLKSIQELSAKVEALEAK